MATVSTFDMTGKQTGSMELSDAIFGIRAQRRGPAQRRGQLPGQPAPGHPVHPHPCRSPRRRPQALETKGHRPCAPGLDPAPQWTHGGISHGPKPRSYSYTLPKKIRRLAMKSAFSSKVAAGEMLVLDGLAFEEIKTKTAAKMLSALEATGKVLLVMPEKDEKAILSMRNIPGVKTALVNTLNVYDILNCDKFIVVKDAVGKIEEVYK